MSAEEALSTGRTMTAALSTRWADRAHRALGGTTDKTVRLAIALGAIRSIIRVVDRSTPPMSADWTEHDPDGKGKSYTDFSGGHIAVNPAPILDTTLDNGAALDVAVGFGLHEASHSQESRDRYKYLIKREVIKPPTAASSIEEEADWTRTLRNPSTVFSKDTGEPTREVPAFSPMRIAAYLWNLVEDVRIEQATSSHWPGFAPYFDRVLDYMWAEMRKHHELPKAYGSSVTERLRVVYLACRYPARLDAYLAEYEAGDDATLAAEVAWWRAWQHDYLSDTVDTPTTIQRGLDHLAEDAMTRDEMEGMALDELRERAAGERLRDQIRRLINEGVGGFEVCVSDEGEVIPLDAETAEAVRQLVREGLVEHQTVVTVDGVTNAPVRVRRPEETAASRRAYVGKPDATTEALRAALVFRPSAPQHDEKLLKSGRMDDEELYRWGLGDMRVFSERVVESKPDVFMGLLVDCSGSMYGSKLKTAQRLAQLMVWAVHDQEGIETAVWAHTADVGDEASEVYRIWAKGDPLSRLGILGDLPNHNNRDHQAIERVASQIALAEQPEKVLIVLSDGLPQAGGYGGRSAMSAVRAVVRWAAGRGVRVIQVAVDDNLRADAQSAMYGTDWIGYQGDASLPRQLAAILGRFM